MPGGEEIKRVLWIIFGGIKKATLYSCYLEEDALGVKRKFKSDCLFYHLLKVQLIMKVCKSLSFWWQYT